MQDEVKEPKAAPEEAALLAEEAQPPVAPEVEPTPEVEKPEVEEPAEEVSEEAAPPVKEEDESTTLKE